MSPRVSVVVPVYNPGPALEPCIASLLGQSMPRDELEIILVDDGSTDGTPARLDEVAAANPNVQVFHIPGSGAPGRPRNVGLEAARGEYVHFVDADDVLAPRALEWLTGMADRNDSDIVIGKYASATLERSQGIFTHSRDRGTLADTPELMTTSWAPAKLFRVAMLRERGITFPEGWRWMEDQLFLLRAYFAARTISVFADAPCYYFVRRDDGGHLSAEDIEPEARVSHLGEVFDLIEAEAPAGPLRDQLLRRFYRANILSTFDERYLAASEPARERLFEHFSAFASSRVPEAIDDTFSGVQRVRARLLRTGDAEGMLAVTRRLEDLDLHVTVRTLRWRRGRLVVDLAVELRRSADGAPLIVVVRDGTASLDPGLTLALRERVAADLDGIRARVSLQEAASAVEWIVPGVSTVVLTDAGAQPGGGRRKRCLVKVSVEIDPGRVGPAGLGLARGHWSVAVRWRGLSIKRIGRIPRPAATSRPLVPAVFGDPPTLVLPRFDEDGLSLEVGASRLTGGDWQPGDVAVTRDGRSLEVALPVLALRGTSGTSGTFILRGPSGDREWPGVVEPDLGRLRLRSRSRDFGPRSEDGAEWPLAARLGPPFDVEIPLGAARIDGAGGIHVAGVADVAGSGIVRRAWRRLSWHVRSNWDTARATLRERAGAMARLLPAPVRHRLVRGVRGLRRRRS